ncbi:predicted protein [Postia placenta Mad-698-R]|nr:predicted protein [Postia placenta Mad-698-R]
MCKRLKLDFAVHARGDAAQVLVAEFQVSIPGASLASSTCAAASSSRLPKRALSAVAKAASFAKGVVTPWVPNCTDTSWAKKGVAQYMRSWDRNRSHSMMVFPSYRRGSRSLSVSLSGGDAGDDITGDEGDGGLPVGEDGCCDCPLGELREERVLEQPCGGDGGGGDGGSPEAVSQAKSVWHVNIVDSLNIIPLKTPKLNRQGKV